MEIDNFSSFDSCSYMKIKAFKNLFSLEWIENNKD